MIQSAVTRFSPPYVTLSVTAELFTGLLQKPCKQKQLVTGNSPVTAEQPPPYVTFPVTECTGFDHVQAFLPYGDPRLPLHRPSL